MNARIGRWDPAVRTASWLGAALVATLLSAASANAQTACGDSTCAKGFVCQKGTSCAETDPGGGAEPSRPCEEVERCVPGPCATDADCASDLLCAERKSVGCTGAAPDCAGPDCKTPEPEDCTEVVERLCLPKWALPCAVDADCGAGFSCVERNGGCSGGSTGTSPPSGSSGAGSTPTPETPEPDGGCAGETSSVKRCEPLVVACTAATGMADPACPSGWTCRDNPEGSCWADSNGNMGCTPADPPKLCFPPYAGIDSGSSFDGRGTAGGKDAESAAPATASGGCSFAAHSTSAPLWASALSLLGFAAWTRRRSRRAA